MCTIDSVDDILAGGNDVTLCVSTVDGDSCGSVRVIEEGGMCNNSTEVEVDTLGGLMPGKKQSVCIKRYVSATKWYRVLTMLLRACLLLTLLMVDVRGDSSSPWLGDITGGGSAFGGTSGCALGIIDPQTVSVGFVWKTAGADIISFGLICDEVSFGPLMSTAAGPLPSVTTAGNTDTLTCLPQSANCDDGSVVCPSGQYLVGMGVAMDGDGSDDIEYIQGVCSGGDVIATSETGGVPFIPSGTGPVQTYDCPPGMAIREFEPWARGNRARALQFQCFPPLRPLLPP